MSRLMFLFCLVFTSVVAAGSDPMVGDKVFVKDGAEAKNGDEVVDVNDLLLPSIVEDVSGDMVWLGRAWVDKSNVMSIQEALDFRTEQIRIEPANAAAWRLRSFGWTAKHKFDMALEDATEAIRLDPKSALSYVARGIARVELFQFDPALADFNEAIKLDPTMVRNSRALVDGIERLAPMLPKRS